MTQLKPKIELADPANHLYRIGDKEWFALTIWGAAKNVTVEIMSAEEVNDLYDDCLQRGAYENWCEADALRTHYADLSYPIQVIMENDKKRIVDGYHRLALAQQMGCSLLYQVITLPEPDFISGCGTPIYQTRLMAREAEDPEEKDYGSLIRNNLMRREGYSPYCAAEKCPHRWPRTRFDGEQFVCRCGFKTTFHPAFIKQYIEKWYL